MLYGPNFGAKKTKTLEGELPCTGHLAGKWQVWTLSPLGGLPSIKLLEKEAASAKGRPGPFSGSVSSS